MWPNDFSFNEYKTLNLVFFQMKREKELSIERKGNMEQFVQNPGLKKRNTYFPHHKESLVTQLLKQLWKC